MVKKRPKHKRAIRSRAERDLEHLARKFNVSRQQIAGPGRADRSPRRKLAPYLAKRKGS